MLDITQSKILVTGGSGFLGRFVVDELKRRGVPEKNIFTPTRDEADLTKLEDVKRVMEGKDIVIHLAAKLGGIKLYMDEPADVLRENVIMDAQVLEASRLVGIKKLVAIGSSAAYPHNAQVPLKEENLWSGYPEEVAAPYAIAKRMLLVGSKAYRQEYGLNSVYLILANLYGPRFDEFHTGVIPSLIRKVYDAKKNRDKNFEVWGTGNATREFLYVEDAARGVVDALQKYDKSDPVNLGSGEEVSIKRLAETIGDKFGFDGEIVWDASKPEGEMRRFMDVSRASKEFGFKADVMLDEGIKRAVEWYISSRS